MRQPVALSEEKSGRTVGVNQLVAAATIATVAVLLVIAVISAGGAQDAPTFGARDADMSEQSANNEAMIRAIVSFGPIGAWVSVGALLLARANPGRALKLGRSSTSAPGRSK